MSYYIFDRSGGIVIAVMNEIIEKSIKNLKDDIKEFPEHFFDEHTMQGRLYHHICKEIDNSKKINFNQIKLECYGSKYNKNLKQESKLKIRERDWRKFVKENHPDYDNLDMEKNIGKKGRYDILLFDNPNKISDVIELKIVNDTVMNPKNTHKLYEDLYVLSNEFLGNDINSYFFVYSKHKKENDSEIRDMINVAKKTYEKAGAEFNYHIEHQKSF